MARVNLTLDGDTHQLLSKHASRAHKPAASLARELIREGLQRQEARERAAKLAKDYAAGRDDARELLRELEAGQLEAWLHAED